MKTVSRLSLLTLGFALSGIPSANADGTYLPLLSDTFVGDGIVHGADQSTVITPTKTGLLRFSLSSLPQGVKAADIEIAQLLLFIGDVSTGGTVKVLTVAPQQTRWNEKLTTTLPPLTTTASPDMTILKSMAGQYILVDVTNSVKAWFAAPFPGSWPYSNNGLAIVTKSGTSPSFVSIPKKTSAPLMNPFC